MSCDPNDTSTDWHEPTTEEIIDGLIAPLYPSNSCTFSTIDFNTPPPPPKHPRDPEIDAVALKHSVENHLAHLRNVHNKRSKRNKMAKKARKRNRR